MGHLISPVSYRLGISRFWHSLWFSSFKNFGYIGLLKHDWFLNFFFKRFFTSKLVLKLGFIYSHFKVIRTLKKVFCIVYLFDGSYLERYYSFKKIFLTRFFMNFFFNKFFKFSSFVFIANFKFTNFYNFFVSNYKNNFLFRFFFF